MKYTPVSMKKVISAAAILLTVALLSAFALADVSDLMKDAQAAVVTANTRVYKSASTSSASIRVAKGTQVNLLAVKGSWALVENGGVYAYMNASQVSAASAPDYSELMKNAQAAVITANTRVYKSASTSSASIRVAKGTQVNLLAVKGSWALVENGGVYAYVKASQVSAASAPDYSELMKNAQAAVITADTRVYKSASASSASLRVAKGTQVNLLAVRGSWALVENGGVYAYMKASEVTVADDAPSAPETEPDYSSLLPSAKPAVMTADAKVYKTADTSSDSRTLAKGTSVNLLAVNGDWALIERSGSYGFTAAGSVALAPAATPAPTPTPVPDDYLHSDKYSNEQKCYLFLTREMKLNTAAACGILANLRRESNFNPTSGSSYYGIVQWGGGRKSNLISFCSQNGYSYSSLEGQLHFLAYELKQNSSVLEYLQSVPDSAKGAYDAAYHFCYYYERPANKAASSASRGELARDTYYPKYA